jgi:hypothetical protein
LPKAGVISTDSAREAAHVPIMRYLLSICVSFL